MSTAVTSSPRERCGPTKASPTARGGDRCVTAPGAHALWGPAEPHAVTAGRFRRTLPPQRAVPRASARPALLREPPPSSGSPAGRVSGPREGAVCSPAQPALAPPDGRGPCGPGAPLTRTRGPAPTVSAAPATSCPWAAGPVAQLAPATRVGLAAAASHVGEEPQGAPAWLCPSLPVVTRPRRRAGSGRRREPRARTDACGRSEELPLLSSCVCVWPM